MKVRVKLFGPLSQTTPGYNSNEGLEIKLSDEATIDDVFAHLKIPKGEGYMVAMDNRVIKPTETIKTGSVLSILPRLAGG